MCLSLLVLGLFMGMVLYIQKFFGFDLIAGTRQRGAFEEQISQHCQSMLLLPSFGP